MTLLFIDLHHSHDVPAGKWQGIVRLRHEDRQLIADAAAVLGMSFAAFVRSVAMQAASQVHDRLDPDTPQRERREGIELLRGLGTMAGESAA